MDDGLGGNGSRLTNGRFGRRKGSRDPGDGRARRGFCRRRLERADEALEFLAERLALRPVAFDVPAEAFQLFQRGPPVERRAPRLVVFHPCS